MDDIGYAAGIGVLALLALGSSAWILHQLDHAKPEEERKPWWKSWVRSGMVVCVAFTLGGMGPGGMDRYINAASLWALSATVIPIVYRRAGIGIWSYELEQSALWFAWLLGVALFRGTSQADLPLIVWAVCWLTCALLGALVLKRPIRGGETHGIRHTAVDTALGVWAAFLPAVMTFGMLARGSYASAAGCGLTTSAIVATAIGLILTGSSGDRMALVAIGAAWPASMAAAMSHDFDTLAVYCVWTFVALGVGLLLKRVAEKGGSG